MESTDRGMEGGEGYSNVYTLQCVEVYCSVLQRVAVWRGNAKEAVYPIRTPVLNRRIHNKSTDDGIRVCVCMCVCA